MESVGLHVDREQNLTVVTMTGMLAGEHIRHVMIRPEFGTTLRVLWDFRNASFANMHRENLTRVAEEHAPLLPKHATRRTAVVVADEETVPAVRLYFEIARHQFGRQIPGFVTTDMKKARRWLSQYRPPPDRGKPTD